VKEGGRCEVQGTIGVRVYESEGVSPPTWEGSGQGAVPSQNFFNFWFKNCVQAKRGHRPKYATALTCHI